MRTVLLGLAILQASLAGGTEVVLRDGRTLAGRLAMLSSLAEPPRSAVADPEGPLQLIVMLDDDLRRNYVSKRLVREVRGDPAGEPLERFVFRQRILRGGASIRSIGPAVRVQPFDEFGRRIYTMQTAQGPLDVVQGITEMTPRYAKVEGISHIWDMRLATTAIPRDALSRILARQVDPKDIEQRKKVARFYLQSERYEDAAKELQAILKDFPNNAQAREQLEPSIRALRQLAAERLLVELRLRRDAGQHQLVRGALAGFPAEGVAGEVLQAVREMIDGYAGLDARRSAILARLDHWLGQMTDTPLVNQVKPLRDEIAAELNYTTLARLAPFMQHDPDEDLTPSQKIATALSGWLLGADATTTNLAVALSAARVRHLVLQYLNEPVRLTRAQLFAGLGSEEAASPATAAALLAAMKPPMPPPAGVAGAPGLFQLEVPGPPKEPAVPYFVQLPPEYDPYRRYPTVVTLHGANTRPTDQIDWWAGLPGKDGQRLGQATRHGYIVVAPAWTVEHQIDYRYSAREHAAVLDCLRDACRRFSVDTDRVFLSGHFIGGDAAWDLGLAHPDLWAGVLPVVAKADRYVAHYWENAQPVPYYFICGELDGGKMAHNARELDRYLRRGYNTTVVEFQGRGHEDYYDEIQRVFEWTNRLRRDFYPKEFSCSTMRRFDNFFWWVEMSGLPAATVVDPADWPPRNPQPLQVKGTVLGNNGLSVRTGSATVRVWLSPKLLDFSRRFTITVNGRRLSTASAAAEPNLEILLEDVRTRGDRQNPFWAQAEMLTGRGGD